MLAAALCFTLMGAVVKAAGERFSGVEMLAWRGMIGVLLLGGWIIHKRLSLVTSHLREHTSRSLLGTVSILAFFYSLVHLPLATSLTLNYTAPLFITGFLIVRGLVARSIALVMPVLAGFVGVLLILRPALERQDVWGIVAGLSGGATGAAAYMLVKALGQKGEPEWRVVFYFSLTNALVGMVLASLTGWHRLGALDLGLLCLIGVLALAGQLMMTRAFGHGRTLVVAALQYSGIAFACVLGWLVFNESIQWLELVGIGVIAAAGLGATLLSAQRDKA
jgi:S-adenosylmethionine uptake transporter